MITQLITIEKANEIHTHYPNFNSLFFQEQFLLSNLAKDLLQDFYTCINEHAYNKAEVLLVAISSWIKKDVNYYLKFMAEKNKKMYEWDIVCNLQTLGELVNVLDQHKLYNASYLLQRDYSKLNIKYSIMCEHVRLSA
jgi:hypothetical protein